MNPAARLLATYDKLVDVSLSDDTQMMEVWKQVFATADGTTTSEDDIIACLQALRGEVDFVRMRLSDNEVSDELLSTGFARLRDVASPAQLHMTWKSHRGNVIPPENRLSFQWATWVLRNEDEGEASAEEMAELRAELESLETALRTTEMSPYLRDFIQRQVTVIRAALRVYAVQGARPLKEALTKVAGALTVERGQVEAEAQKAEPEAKSLLSKAGAVIEKTAKICDGLDKIGKFGERVWTLAGTVGPLVLRYIANG